MLFFIIRRDKKLTFLDTKELDFLELKGQAPDSFHYLDAFQP